MRHVWEPHEDEPLDRTVGRVMTWIFVASMVAGAGGSGLVMAWMLVRQMGGQ